MSESAFDSKLDVEDTMTKKMSCRDVGPDCAYVAEGETDDEIMQQVAEHARAAHGIDEVPLELAEKARAAIRHE